MPPAKRLAVDHSDDNQQASLALASTNFNNKRSSRETRLKQNGLSVLEKIKKMDFFYKKQRFGTTKLTDEGAKSYCTTFLHPATINRLNNHFDGNSLQYDDVSEMYLAYPKALGLPSERVE
jgi:hypothetical protein